MGCCGSSLNKVASIAQANLLSAMDSLGVLPKRKSRMANTRLAGCRRCQDSTWLTWHEFWTWVDDNGGKVKFFEDIADLTAWPLLPRNKYQMGRKLFCRICKCWVPKKAYLDDEQCPQGNASWNV